MKVEIWSDVMCPWCYIGKRRFESALQDFEDRKDVEIEWRSFQLNPDLKTDPSRSVSEYLSETKGWTAEQTRQAEQHVSEIAKSEGLDYKLDQVVLANSKNAHRLMQYAKRMGKGNEMNERLFKAYFIEALNTDDKDVLIELGKETGLPEQDCREIIESNDFEEQVDKDIQEAQMLGCRGVPFFVIDRKYGITGAQEKETFLKTLNEIK